MRRLVLLGLCAGLGLGVPSQPVGSTRPSELLTFASRFGICLARPDGSRPVRLLRHAWRPSWSPNGRYFSVIRSRRAPERKFGVDMRVLVATSRGRVVRTDIDADAIIDAAWAPDGRFIAAATASIGGGISLVTPGGIWEREVIGSSTTTFGGLAWTPNAERLAFVGVLFPPGATGIYTVRTDGTDPRLLVPGGASPAYSPDGTKLAYIAQGNLYVADADGTAARALITTPGALEGSPAWSPTGALIAFVRTRPGHRGSAILTIHPDGTGERVAIPARYDALSPSWRPAVQLPRAKRRLCR